MHFLVVCVVAYHASCSLMPPVSSFKEQLAAQLFSSLNKKSLPKPICIVLLLYFVFFCAMLFTFLSQRLSHNGAHSQWMLEMGEVILLFDDLVLSVNGGSEFCLRNVD